MTCKPDKAVTEADPTVDCPKGRCNREVSERREPLVSVQQTLGPKATGSLGEKGSTTVDHLLGITLQSLPIY